MKHSIGLGAAALVIASTASAQKASGVPAVDSAAVARAAYARAVKAPDAAQSLREIQRAAGAWPSQPAYLWGEAFLAGRLHDTATTLRALEAYASLSLGRDLGAAKEFAFLSGLPEFQSLKRRHDENRSVLANSRVVRAVGDTSFWPEGVDYDDTAGAYYLGSVRTGAIMRIDSLGRATAFWKDSVARGAVLALRVDPIKRVLWATVSAIPQFEGFAQSDSTGSSLLQIALDDHRVLRRWKLPAIAGGRVLGDVAVGPGGDIYVSDSKNPVLYRLRQGSGAPEPMTHPLFHSLQGIAPSPDGRTLYVADYSHGLLRVDLESGAVTRLPDPAHSTTVGCDGLTLHRASLICVQNGVSPARIMRFDLGAGGTTLTRATILDRHWDVADEPTIGTMAGDEFVYVANSQWEKHSDAGALLPGARLRGPVLLGVAIKP